MKLSNLALATWAYGSLVLVMAILVAACGYIVYHGGPLITVDFLWLYPAGMPLGDRKSTRLNSSHSRASRMPSSA